jgi:hypothetical protein
VLAFTDSAPCSSARRPHPRRSKKQGFERQRPYGHVSFGVAAHRVDNRDLHQFARAPDGRPAGQHLGQARRMLEKCRVQLWAQQLGTAQTVSDARIRTMLQSVAGPT